VTLSYFFSADFAVVVFRSLYRNLGFHFKPFLGIGRIFGSTVARWFVFKPKFFGSNVWVNFAGP
jgi:hypothetical protein